jgi:hypothetical protein
MSSRCSVCRHVNPTVEWKGSSKGDIKRENGGFVSLQRYYFTMVAGQGDREFDAGVCESKIGICGTVKKSQSSKLPVDHDLGKSSQG